MVETSLPVGTAVRAVRHAVRVRGGSGAFIADPPAYDRARAAVTYGDVSRDLVRGLKYQGRLHGLVVLGGWMAGAGAELLAEADLIVPVPLH